MAKKSKPKSTVEPRNRTTLLLIEVVAPKAFKRKAIAALVNGMLNVAFSEAAESLDTDIEDAMRESAEAVTELTITQPRVLKEDPRCRAARKRAKRKSKKKGSSK